MNNSETIQKCTETFNGGDVSNRVIKFAKNSSSIKCVFIPNWRAKPHHWERFCSQLAQDINLDYFETREKPSTIFANPIIDHSNKKVASDVISYINNIASQEYHLILCSFSAPLVFTQWDKILYKPQSLVLICPIYEVRLPWQVRLFSRIPKFAFPLLYKSVFALMSNSKTVKAICKNNQELFKDGNIADLIKFQSSVQEVLKLKIPYTEYRKIDMPTLVIKPMTDKIHTPKACQKIKNVIQNSSMVEVENFRQAHSIDLAIQVCQFINEHTTIDCKV